MEILWRQHISQGALLAGNIFTQQPLELALRRAAPQAPQPTVPTQAPAPQPVPQSAPLATDPDTYATGLWRQTGVEPHLVKAIADFAGVDIAQNPRVAERAAAIIAQGRAQGLGDAEALAAMFPGGEMPQGAAEAILGRASEFEQISREQSSVPGDVGRSGLAGVAQGVGSMVRGLGEATRLTTAPLDALFGQKNVNTQEPLAEDIGRYAQSVRDGISFEGQKAVIGSTPDGDLFKPSTWAFGDEPSARGYAMLAADVLGSMAPVVAGSIAAGPVGGAVAGGLQGGGAGSEQARQAVEQMAQDGTLAQESTYYREAIKRGMSEPEALEATAQAAERMGFLFTLPISALGGYATGALVSPGTKILAAQGMGTRIAGRAAISAAEEGAQEAAESIAARTGANVAAGTSEPVTEGTFGDFMLGALGGAVPGAAGGALSRREDPARATPDAGAAASAPSPEAGPPAPQDPLGLPAPQGPLGLPAPEAVEPPAPSGPLSRATAKGPAPMLPGSKPGDVVTITSEGLDPIEAMVVGETPDGPRIRTVEGEELIIPREEIEAGTTIIQPGTVDDQPMIDVTPVEAPQPETSRISPEILPPRRDPEAKRTYDTPEEIQQRLAFLNDMGRTNGWGRVLYAEKRALEAKLAEIQAATETADPAVPAMEAVETPAGPVRAEPAQIPATPERAALPRPQQKSTPLRTPVQPGQVPEQASEPIAIGTEKLIDTPSPVEEKTSAEDAATATPPRPDTPRGARPSAPSPTVEDLREKSSIVRGMTDPAELNALPGLERLSFKYDEKAGGLIFSRKHADKVRKAMEGSEGAGATKSEKSADPSTDAPLPATREQAEKAGAEAFKSGKARRVPVEWLTKDRLKVSEGWLRGWDRENLAQPVESKPEAEDKAQSRINARNAMLPKGYRVDFDSSGQNVHLFGPDGQIAHALAAGFRTMSPQQQAKVLESAQNIATNRANRKEDEQKPRPSPPQVPPLEGMAPLGKKPDAPSLPENVKLPPNYFQTSAKPMTKAEAEGTGYPPRTIKAIIARQSPYSVQEGYGATVNEALADAAQRVRSHEAHSAKKAPADPEADAWDSLSPEQREDILAQDGGWGTRPGAKNRLNNYGRGIAKKAWADQNETTRATIKRLMEKASSPAQAVPVLDARQEEKKVGARASGREAAKRGDERKPPEFIEKAGLADEWLAGYAEISVMDAAIDDMIADEDPQMPAGFFLSNVKKLNKAEAAARYAEPGHFMAVVTTQNPYSSNSAIEPSRAAAIRAALRIAQSSAKRMAASKKNEDAEKAPKKTGREQALQGHAPDNQTPPDGWGASNKVFTKDAADKARELLKARLKGGTLYSGIDPEIAMAGMQLMGYHLEAGARKFAEATKAVADDLGVSPKDLRKYLRAWYNSSRDMLEDSGESIEGMDDDAAVRAALKAMDAEQETGDERAGRGQSGDVGGAGEPQAGPGLADGESAGDAGNPDVEGAEPGPVSGDAEAAVPSPAGARPDAAVRRPRKRTDRAADAPSGRPDAGDGGTDDVRPGRDEPAPRARGNYHLSDPERLIAGGPKARFAKNRAAIETYHRVTDEGREPTPEELDTIAAYIGWGSFGQELFKGTWDRPQPKEGWKDEDEWLREHLGEEAWKGAQNSIINAHYTDPPTVQAMWGMVEKMGFTGGRVLEPSMGIGNFFGLMPRYLMEKSQLTGIELDPTTGGMAKMLYPDANVRVMGYEESKTPDDFYDLVIGNWPFANFQPSDRRYDRLSASLHDYFFVKALDQVRPGGIVMGITSSFTMDGVKNRAVKSYLAKRADLVASFRLPTGAFEGYAGTSVVTDIIILKKRPEQILDTSGEEWTRSSDFKLKDGQTLRLNEYYQGRPENILGELAIGHGTTFGKAGMIVNRQPDFPQVLAALPERVPANTFEAFKRETQKTYVANSTTDRIGSVVVGKDGEFYRVEGDQMVLLDDVAKWKLKDEKKTEARRQQIAALIDLRKAAGAVLDADRDGLEDAEQKRAALKSKFEAITKAHGRIRDMEGLKALRRANDPNADLLQALEREDGSPAAILDKPVVRAKKALDNPTITQAYVAARNESTRLNLARVAEIAGKPVEEVADDLLKRGAIYRTPGGGYEASEVYLSGNVRQKLKDALAAEGEDLAGSIEALKKVIPEDVPYFDIEARMGADWMPKEDTEDFIAEKLGITGGRVELRRGASGWNVTVPDEIARRGDISTFTGAPLPGKRGTGLSLKRFLEAALNTQTVSVTEDDGKGGTTADKDSTDKANARLGEVRMEFKDWVWTDPERRIRLEAAYNDAMNAIATPIYDGSFLEFPGLTLEFGDKPFNLRSHQRNAIWRGLLNRRGIYGHEVGTGKSLTIAGIAIESRRYGIAKKPLVIGHNANARALANEIQAAYPAAKVLFVDNLSPKTIGRTLNQIATDEWDAVVIPHSLIDRMALSEKTLMAMAEEDIAAFEAEALAAAEEEGITLTVEEMGETEDLPDDLKKKLFRAPTAKEAVKARNRLISSLKKQAAKASKEGAVPFEDLGLDMILVDESHEFKKPPIATRMSVRGLNKGTSARSMQMKFLTRYVKSMRGGDGIHTFTGTPITNTLTEIYHQMTYVMDDVMRENYVDTWDGFFKTFADSIADIEVTSAGDYENVERLAAFVNVSELRRMAGQYLDIVFADEMPEFTPRTTASGKTIKSPDLTEEERDFLENGRTENPMGRPYKKIIHDIGAMGEDQRAILEEVMGYARAFREADGKTRREIMLKGGPDAPIVFNNVPNRASMDARLHDMSAEDHPQSKANRAVRNIADIYHENPMATQVLFMDEGFSDHVTRERKDDEGNVVEKIRVEKLNLAKDIKAKLVAQGVKEEEIVIVGGGVTAEKKAEIARKMNNLEVRVVIGQTATLGVGVNMQKYLRAMHHLDAPWMPGELEQRNGRGERQGNTWNTVLEYRYLTEGLDGRRWQVLAIKDRFIKAFMKAKEGVRVIEGDATDDSENMDAGSLTDTLSEAAGDPRIMLLAKASKKVERLEQRKRTHELGVSDALRRARNIAKSLEGREKRMETFGPVVDLAQSALAGEFEMTIAGKTYDKRADAGAALDDANRAVLGRLSKGQSAALASTRGFEITASINPAYGTPVYSMKYQGFSEDVGKPTVGSIDAALRRIARMRDVAESSNAEDRATLARLETASKQTFRQEEELKKAKQVVSEITADLEMNPVPPPSWLRQGAPVDTLVFVDGDERVVTGHRWTDDGWFVQTDKGTVPYTSVTTESGVPIYDEREFEPPKVEEGSKKTEARASIGAEIRGGFASSALLREHYERGPLGSFVVKLLGSGKLVLHDTPASLPGGAPSGAQGVTTPDGTVHIVASAVNGQTADAVLFHEFFHSGVESLLGTQQWHRLLGRVADISSRGQSSPWWSAARRRGNGSPEEIAAYAIETRESAPHGLAEIADNLIGMVKAFVLRKLGRQLGRVTPGQLRSLAIAAVKTGADGGRGPNGGMRYSMADTMAARLVGAERSILSQTLTQAMAGAGGTNLLGLVPGRALFAELAAKMPAAQEYLRLKGLMDTLRNEWHERMDTTAQEWRKLISKNGAANADMMDIMHQATLHGVDPSFPLRLLGTDEDKQRKVEYARLRERFKALPAEMQRMFHKVRDEYKALGDEFEATLLANIEKAMDLGLRKAQRDHEHEMKRIVDEGLSPDEAKAARERADKKLAGTRRRLGWGKRARMADMRAKFETQRIQEPYFPLARFGQFFVAARDEDGKVVSFSRFESVRKRDKEADQLKADGYKVEVGALGETKLRDMVDPTFVNDVEGILMDAGVPDAVMDQVWQRWLETMPDMSLRKNRLHRKGTPGWNEDAFRAFGHHMFHGSHQLARLKYAMELQEALDVTREQANRQEDPTRAGLIVNEIEKRHDHIMNPTGSAWAQRMTSAAFYYYLAVTPAAAMVNLSQTTIMGTSILGAYHGKGGMRAASRHLIRAGRDFFHGKGHAVESDRLTQDEKDAMRAAYKLGTIDKSQAHDLAGVGETGVEYSAWWQKWSKILSWTFHHTERMNREVTYLAAYRMAREKGLDHMNAVDKAADLTWRTHFDYQSSSRPRFMTADWARVVFTFRNFQVNMLWRLFRDAHQALRGATTEERTEARRQLIGVSAMLLAHAGIRGVWGYGLIMTLLAMFTPGDADDLEDEMKGAITGLLGNQIGGMLLNGVPGHLTGTDLTSRIGMPDLWFRAPDRQLEGEDEYFYWVEQALGPVFGIAKNVFVGMDMMAEDPWRGAEKIAPKALRDQMRAVRYEMEGATTFNGNPIIENVSPYQVVMQALGFTPAELSEQYGMNRLMKNREARIDDERSGILADYTRALRAGKQPSPRVIRRMQEFNAKYPMWAIGSDTIQRSYRSRIRASQHMQGGISLNDKIEPMIRESLSNPVYR